MHKVKCRYYGRVYNNNSDAFRSGIQNAMAFAGTEGVRIQFAHIYQVENSFQNFNVGKVDVLPKGSLLRIQKSEFH